MLNKYKLILKIFFAASIIVVLFYSIDIKEFLKLFSKISWWYFSVTILIIFFDQILMGLKWQLLLRMFNINIPSIIPVMAYLRGRIFLLIAPSTLGIDVYKTFYIKKFYPRTAPIISSIIAERFLGALSSIAIILLLLNFSIPAYHFSFLNHSIHIASLNLSIQNILIYSGIIGFFTLAIFIQLISSISGDSITSTFFHWQFLSKILNSFKNITNQRKNIWFYYTLSIFEKISYGLVIYFSARALNLNDIDPLFIIAATPLLAMAERLPISVASIGLREGLFVALFTPFFQDISIAVAVSLILRLAEIVQIALVSAVWLYKNEPDNYKDDIVKVEKEIAHIE